MEKLNKEDFKNQQYVTTEMWNELMKKLEIMKDALNELIDKVNKLEGNEK